MFPEKIYGASTRIAGDPSRVALLLPGRGYTVARPLLHYARKVLLAHDWTVQEIWWEVPDDLAGDDSAAWVDGQTRQALDREDAASVLLVGKSLGTLAAPLAVERRLPAIWLTPLLHLDGMERTLGLATAPTLLIGGTRDVSWPPGAAQRTGQEYLELPGADHALELMGDPMGSVENLARATAAMTAFVAGLGR
ncbi:MAG: alpha/beta hydrolase [Thermoactinospora sp.]|nr:alpha/beta hydrolase [Thermoactinospora sp.]